MTQATMVSPIPPAPSLERAWEDVGISFERFCLTDLRQLGVGCGA